MFDFLKKRSTVEGPLLSVIIPSYNHEKYIGQAIESVLQQSYWNLELIVIDDGSTDRSREVIESYQDKRMSFIWQENSGAHAAINRGLAMAKGDYLAILNSDDVFSMNRFEVMIKEMQENPQIGFLCSYIQVIDSNGGKLGVKKGWRNMEPWTLSHPELSFAGREDFKLNLLLWNFTSTTSNFLFTRGLYETIGGMRNLRFAHDWDFALRAAEVTECKLIEKPLMNYRIHKSNTISSDKKWMLFEIIWIWAANLERFYGKLFCLDQKDAEDIFTLAESLNLQGNDRVFWMIRSFIEAQRKIGVEHPEEILLEEEGIRKRFLEYVVE